MNQNVSIVMDATFSGFFVSPHSQLRAMIEVKGSDSRSPPRVPERLPISLESQMRTPLVKILRRAITGGYTSRVGVQSKESRILFLDQFVQNGVSASKSRHSGTRSLFPVQTFQGDACDQRQWHQIHGEKAPMRLRENGVAHRQFQSFEREVLR